MTIWTKEKIEVLDHECACCGRWLKPGKKVWLELDCYTGKYHVPGSVPEDRSQGEFPFGPGCAKKALAEGAC